MTSLERCCRICAHDQDAGVMIFGSRGHEMMLRDSILKYLQVEITLNDKLPKMVCIKCCTQIDSIRIFAQMAREAQKTLAEQLENQEPEKEKKKNGESSSYLLDGCTIKKELVIKEENEDPPASEEDDITEMEVRLDPMMFLDSQSDEEDEENDKTSCKNDYAVISTEEECATLTKIIENPVEPLTIQLVRLTRNNNTPIVIANKTNNKNKSKTLPDLKPLKATPTKQDMAQPERPYVCSYCPRSYFSHIALLNHVWLHTNKETNEYIPNGKLICPICRKDMGTKSALSAHMESHRPKGKYICDICGRVFKTQSNLHRHKMYHGSEIYTCKVCRRVYPTNSTLRAHSVTHSDARPHNCPLCKKTFKRNQDLKFHINQHTGARPYRCPYCPKAFASSGNCFSHRKRMHPAEVERDRDKSGQSDRSS